MRLRQNALAAAIVLSALTPPASANDAPLASLPAAPTTRAPAETMTDVVTPPAVPEVTDLLQTLHLASANDPNVAAVRASRAAAEQGTAIARASLMPQLVASGAISNNDLTQTVSPGQSTTIPPGDYTSTYRNTQWALKLTQPIFAWDVWHQYQAARAQRSQAEAQADDQTQSLLLATAEAYFNVLRAEDDLALSKAQEVALDKQLEQAQARFQVGQIARADVLESEARRDNANAQRLNADINVVNTRETLNAAVGRDLGPLAGLGENLPMEAPIPDSADDWVQLAREQNPGLSAARFNAVALGASRESLKAGYLPRVNLFASYGDRSNSNLNAVAAANSAVAFNAGTTKSVGVEAQWEVFASGRTHAALKQADFQTEAARQQALAREHQVVTGTRTGFLTVKTDSIRLQARRRAQTSAQAAYDVAKAGYDVGTRNIVDLLLAETNLFAAKRDYANARYDYVIHTLRLHASAGELNEALIGRINSWLRPPVAPAP